MEYCDFGKAGFKVSKLSFGASSLGSVFRPISEEAGIRAVHLALDRGINYIDVAPAYGHTVAETVLGKALKGIPRHRYHISTKVGNYGPRWQGDRDTRDYSKKRILLELEASAKRIGVEYFDILHIHDLEYQNRSRAEQALTEGFETLSELKRQGRIGAVSFGIYPIDLWQRILNSLEIDAMLCHNHYCLNDTLTLSLLPVVKEKKIGLINGSPFASGLLTGRKPPDWHPATREDREVFLKAADFCNSEGYPLPKLALQFSSQNPDIPTTLFSSANPDSVERNIGWHEEPADMDMVSRVREILKPVLNKQWMYDPGVLPPEPSPNR